MNKTILDASAALAVFFEEAGTSIVEPVLFGAAMSAVNYSEVLKKIIEKGGVLRDAKGFLSGQAIRIIPFEASHAEAAANILPYTSAYGLSFADRACVSLGLSLGYKIYTAERRMAKTSLAVKVKLIR